MLLPDKSWVKVHHLPPQPTPFFGRANEVVELIGLLTDPTCRLLTLVGPGGIGKTRLAIQTAGQLPEARSLNQAEGSVHDVYFVSLQSINSTDFLISAIANALRLTLSGQEPAARQLFNHLRVKEILLILDNFEQLLGLGGDALLADLLETAPKVKLLVTSREALNLQEEWLYPVHGLPFPPFSSQPSPEAAAGVSSLKSLALEKERERYSAIQLFVERARRVRRDFSLADEWAGIVRICQLTDGMPLALELAASWVKTLNSAAIAAEIQQSVDFLTTSLRNIPEQHRSMRAVFDRSWQQLNPPEQEVFKRLSVFRGGFRRAAAEQVAGGSLTTLSALVDKSLLRWESDGRYQIHGLLRQYAEERLEQSPEKAAQVHYLHSAYYADFLAQQAAAMTGGKQREATREIAADLENIRAAWQWAVQTVNVAAIQKSIYTLQLFYDIQSRYLESMMAFEQAIQSLDSQDPTEQTTFTIAYVLVYLGWACIRTGQLDQAQSAFDRSSRIFNELGMSPPVGFGTDPLLGLGILANIRGDYARATQLGEEAHRLNQARNDKHNLQIAFYVLTNAALAQGQYQAARDYAQQAYRLTKETNNLWFSAYVLNDLGNIARAQGDYAQARQHYQAGYHIREEFDDPEGMALALNHLGEIAWLQGQYQEARKLHQQSQTIYRQIDDQGGLAASLNGLGNAAGAMGDYLAAQQCFQQALQITTRIQFVPLTLTILIGIAELWQKIAHIEESAELLVFALQHPATGFEARAKARQLLSHYQTELPAHISAATAPAETTSDFERVITWVQVKLTRPIDAKRKDSDLKIEDKQLQTEPEKPPFLPSIPHPPPSALPEPLTPRELEVLFLIAAGLTNQQIAEQLVISVGTTKFYTSQIYSKLNVSSRTQAVAYARDLGLLA
jgi:predicted ATPase/DNA-binding CsgD family transcriptional regulator